MACVVIEPLSLALQPNEILLILTNLLIYPYKTLQLSKESLHNSHFFEVTPLYKFSAHIHFWRRGSAQLWNNPILTVAVRVPPLTAIATSKPIGGND